MKHLILNLKKKVLIVEVPNKTLDVKIMNNKANNETLSIRFYNSKVNHKVFLLEQKGLLKFICKGSDLTEEIASAFFYQNVISMPPGNIDVNLMNFEIFVKNSDFHWLENPFKEPTMHQLLGASEVENSEEKEWQEAEEKTFKNCLIFEIIE